MTKIRVLVVDDSPTVRGRLIEILTGDPEFEVIGQAADGRRAVALCTELRPDVMTLDLALPEMSGLAVTEHVMAHAPTPILIVSSSFNRGELFDTYEALAAGAVDVLDKSGADADDDSWDSHFVAAVRMVSRIRVITHPRGLLGALGRPRGKPVLAELAEVPTIASEISLIALGASTGGPAALAGVLSDLPADFPLPILVVLHIDAAFSTAFASWLGTHSRRIVRCAADGEPLVRGGPILVAPPHRHLVISKQRTQWSDAPPRNFCKPSIDVLFESIALDYGPSAMACLLTGMGRDGAAGLLAIRLAGGTTIAQDEATSVVWGMPREAVAKGAASRVLPLDKIGAAIRRTVHKS